MRFALAIMLLLIYGPSEAATLENLIQSIHQQQQQHRKLIQQREAHFIAAHDEQKRLLQQSRQRLTELETVNQSLLAQEQANRKLLSELQQTRQAQAGELLLAADVIRRHAATLADKTESSALTSMHPQTGERLRQLLSGKSLPSAAALETLWLAYLQSLSDSGRIIRRQGAYIDRTGNRKTGTLIHIGPFATFTANAYLQWQRVRKEIYLPERQPSRQALSQAKAFSRGSGDILPVTIDPSHKALNLLGKTPSPRERIQQGGYIGYIILALGLTGLVIALTRLLILGWTGLSIRRQLGKLDQPRRNNPLGRILLSSAKENSADDELVKTRLQEAVLEEVPRLDRGRGLIKLLAAVTPMLGLLGTVTGMITTFQTISHFGTGDPRLMANGISEALMTTLLGLGTAIPLLFLHSLLSAKTKGLVQVLYQQSAGLLVRHLETARQ